MMTMTPRRFCRTYRAWRKEFGIWRSLRNAWGAMMIDPFGFGQRRLDRVYKREGIEGVLKKLKP